jgi:hypothetical protein
MEALEGWIALAGIEVNNQDRFEAIRINRMHSKDNVPFAAVDRRSALDAVAALYSGGVAQALRWLSTWIPSLEDVARGNAQP